MIIGTTGTTTPFLPESELPPCARLTGNPEENEQQAIAKAIEQSKREHGGVANTTTTTTAASTSTSSQQPQQTAGYNLSNINTIQAVDRFTEQDVSDLMALGYPRSDVLTVLRLCNGDKAIASSMLVSRNEAAGSGGFS